MGDGLCGAEPCNKIVDRLGDIMADQQRAGFESLEKLMIVHHAGLHDEIADLKNSIKYMGDEVFPRLRDVEAEVKVIKARFITEDKVEEVIEKNENIIWLGRARSRMAQVGVGVLIVVILSIPAWLPKVLSLFSKDGK